MRNIFVLVGVLVIFLIFCGCISTPKSDNLSNQTSYQSLIPSIVPLSVSTTSTPVVGQRELITPTSICMQLSMSSGSVIIDEQQNNSIVCLPNGSNFTLKLTDYSRLGVSWNLTMSPGLKVTNYDLHWVNDKGDTVPAGTGYQGWELWDITIMNSGNQTIYGDTMGASPLKKIFNLTILVR